MQSSGITIMDQATARANTSSYLPNKVRYPYSLQWNLGVQHSFAKNYTGEIRYVGTRGVDLDVQNRLNVMDVVTPDRNLPTYLTAPSQSTLDALPYTLSGISSIDYIDPKYAALGFTNPIVGYMPWGASTYHGMQTQLTRRMANGLQFLAAYTWSHAIDNSTADFFSTIVAPRRPQNFRDLPAERANSVLDHRHRFTLQAIYDMPYFKNHPNWFVRNFAGNYEFAPVFIYETGGWGTIQSGVDSNLNGDSAGDRAILNPSGTRGIGSGVSPMYSTNTCAAITDADAQATCYDDHTVAYLADNPNAQYIVAAPGALANTPRNTLQMNPINSWDFTLLKRISLTERYKIEFAAQLFNAFNHPNWVPGFLNQVDSISRTDQGERNGFIPDKTNFDNWKNTWGSNPRTMQFYLKFIF